MKAPFLLTDWFGNHCGWLSGGGGCGEDVFLNLCMQDANSGMSTLGENSLPLNSTESQGQSAESLNLQLSSINHATDVSSGDVAQTGFHFISILVRVTY